MSKIVNRFYDGEEFEFLAVEIQQDQEKDQLCTVATGKKIL